MSNTVHVSPDKDTSIAENPAADTSIVENPAASIEKSAPTVDDTDVTRLGNDKKDGLTSEIWKHYKRFQDSKGAWKARCKYCMAILGANTVNGTSSLTKHVNKTCKARSHGNSSQSLLTVKESGGVTDLGTWKYDPVAARKKLAEMLIIEELPFKLVDGVGFRAFVESLNPKFRFPSRFTTQRDCFAIYGEEKQKLLNFFKDSDRMVSLTTDTWTSIQNVNYMCVTIHFIDDDWNICKKLLSFKLIHSHKGKDLAFEISKVLKDWGISKIFTITVDNASSNDSMIGCLKNEFGRTKGSLLGCEFLHMRCVAHILNLVCVDGLKLKDANESICRIREAVRYVRHSPKRLTRFKECMLLENDQSKVELVLDVKTRWNSTYFMLDAALRHERVWKSFEQVDNLYCLEMASNIPTSKDWDYARMLHNFLKTFYELTLKISGSKYCTCNVFWSEIVALNDMLISMRDADDEDMKTMAIKMKEKFDKYWGDPLKMNPFIFIAVVMDPRFKMTFLEYTLALQYGSESVNVKNIISKTLGKLFRYYNPDGGSSNVEAILNEEIITNKIVRRWQGASGRMGRKTELEIYLEENVVSDEQNFDILQWWKVSAVRFPILSRMARDILAMPISTVSSESSFSTGGRVLDSYRSSLAPLTVEMLLCCQDWLRGSFLPKDIDESVADLEVVVKEMTKEMSGATSTDNSQDHVDMNTN